MTLNHAALLRCHATLPGPYHRWKPPPWQSQRWCHHGHGASNALRNGNGKEGLPDQPNITSLGTLSSLTTSGNATIGGDLTVNGTTTTFCLVLKLLSIPRNPSLLFK